MTLVMLALGAGLHLQLGVTGQAAFAAAALMWVVLLAMHIRVRRAQAAMIARAPPRDTGKATADRDLAAVEEASAALQRRARVAARTEPANRSRPPPLPVSARPAPPLRASSSPAADLGQAHRPREDAPSKAYQAPRAAAPELQAARREDQPSPAAMGWDLRPGAHRDPFPTATRPAVFPPLHHAPEHAAHSQDSAHGPRAATAMSSRSPMGAEIAAPESQVQPQGERVDAKVAEARAMQSIIDQLARQLTAPSESDLAVAAGTGPAREGPEQALAQSVEALRSAGSAMRAAAPAGANAELPDRPAMTPASDRGAPPTDFVAGGRPEVYLDSILGLEDRKARHFEISLCIRTEAGELLAGDDYGFVLAGGGLRTQIDAAKLERVARIAERLSIRGASARLFVNLAAESLVDDGFLDACAGVVTGQPAITGQLVLSFTQGEVRAFAKPHWDTLATLRENGLHFAAETLGDLAMDFAILKGRGFEFAKIDASVLLAGMQAHDGIVPPLGICRRLADAGLGLVVTRIDDEASLTQVAALGVSLGQGAVFGTPRPVKVELKAQQVAAA